MSSDRNRLPVSVREGCICLSSPTPTMSLSVINRIDRDRGAPHGAAPPTPPGIRVAYHGGPTRLGGVPEHKVGGDRLNQSGGCAGPLGPPGALTSASIPLVSAEVTAALNCDTPRRRSSLKRLRPFPHCLQRYERNLHRPCPHLTIKRLWAIHLTGPGDLSPKAVSPNRRGNTNVRPA